MADTCQDEREKHEELFEEWSECNGAISELQETGLMMDASVAVACGGGAAAGFFGVGACAIALWALADAIDDLDDQIEKCNKIALKVNASGAKWRECAEEHKNDP